MIVCLLGVWKASSGLITIRTVNIMFVLICSVCRNQYTRDYRQSFEQPSMPRDIHLANIKNAKHEEIWGLLEDKHRLHKANEDDTGSVPKTSAYNSIWQTVQSRLSGIQVSLRSKKAEVYKSFAEVNDMEKIYYVPKTVYGPKSSAIT